ncbi:MAG: hypothetical protein U0W40_13755 [Acidimicrobiia bacterium]
MAAAVVWAQGERDAAQQEQQRLRTELAVQRDANTPTGSRPRRRRSPR